MQITSENAAQLCYLPAADVKCPAGYMGGLELRGLDNERLGRLSGVLVDTGNRRLQYLVVDAPGGRGRCCLIAPDEIVCLDPNYRTLRVAAPADAPRREYDLDWLRFYCDSAEIVALAS